MNFIQQHISSINHLCKQYRVKELYAYGSVTDSELFTPQSDVDLIVKFKEEVPVEAYADLYFDLAESLEEVLHRKVDLMTDKPIQNRILKAHIEASKQQIYAA